MNIKPSVQIAIDELRAQFGTDAVTVDEDGQGGAYVRVLVPPLPAPYKNPAWLGFHIAFTYPAAEIYPVFSRSDLRDDNFQHQVVSQTTWRGQPVTQLSLRIQKHTYNQRIETAVGKVLKVIQWLRDPK